MDWLGLQDKAVLITGAAGGIGKAVAEGFIAVGAHVVVADVVAEAGEATAAALTAAGPGRAVFAPCDVTDKAQVEAAVQVAVDTFGGLHALVNNAGINIPRLLVDPAGKEELTEGVWDKVCLLYTSDAADE